VYVKLFSDRPNMEGADAIFIQPTVSGPPRGTWVKPSLHLFVNFAPSPGRKEELFRPVVRRRAGGEAVHQNSLRFPVSRAIPS